MDLKTYYQPENFYLRLLFLSLLVLPFHTLTGIIIILFIAYKLWQKNYQQIISDRLSHLLLFSTVLMFISTLFAYNSTEAWLGVPHFIPFFLVFLAFKTLINRYEHLYFIVLPLVFNSLLVVFYGFAEVKLGWTTSLFLYRTLGWQLTGTGDPVGRFASVFPYANLVALYLVIILILCFSLLIERKKKAFDKLNLFLIFAIILNTISLVATSSRNAWFLYFLSLIVFAIYLGWNWIIKVLSLGAILVIGASFGNFPGQDLLRKIVPSFIWQRFSDQAYPDRPLSTLRVTQWNFCLDLIKERPLFGWGLRNFTVLYEEKTATYLGHPHNFYLMLGAETGLLNLAILSVTIAWILVRGVQTFRHLKTQQEPILYFSLLMIMGAYLLYNFLDVNLFDLRLNTMAWLVLAAISGISDRTLKVRSKE